MKLEIETNVLVNHRYTRATIGQPAPEVGMGATILYWPDRTAVTIISVTNKGRTITVQKDHARCIDKNGMSDCQEYEHTPNLEAPTYIFRLSPKGIWREAYKNPTTGRYRNIDGSSLRIGMRQTYFDFTF